MKKISVVLFFLVFTAAYVCSAAVNLIVPYTSVIPGGMNKGSTYSITVSVQNTGSSSTSTSFYISLNLSPTSTYSSSTARYLGDIYVSGGIGAGVTRTFNQNITIPCDYAYSSLQYLLVSADATGVVSESNESDNVNPFTVVIYSMPDLRPYPGTYSLSTTSIPAGTSIGSNSAVQNIGTGSAGGFTVGFYLSPTISLVVGSAGTFLVGSYPVSTPICGSCGTTSNYAPLTIPSSVCAGTYYLHMFVDNGSAISECLENNNTTYITVTVTGTSPPVPTSLSPTTISSSSIYLSWGGSSYSYQIYDCSGSYIASTTSNNYTVGGLTPGIYSYKVRAVNSCSVVGAFTSCQSATVTPSCTSPSASVPPQTGTGTVTMWCYPSGGSGGTYYYQWYNGSTCSGSVIATTQSLTVSTSGYYSCKANISTCFSSCAYGYATVIPPCVPPSPPSAYSATSMLSTSFQANWSSVPGATGGYYIDVSPNSGFTSFVSGYNNYYVGSSTSVAVTGLLCSSNYYYHVRSSNGSCSSGNSSSMMASTGACCTGPSAPTITSATGITTSSFIAHWTTGTSASGYYIDVSPNSGFTSFVSGYNNYYVSGGSTTSQSITGLMCGTTYYYRVRSTSSCSTSGSIGNMPVITGSCSVLTISPSSIPAWQREAEPGGFSGTVNVNITPSFSSWRLEVYVNGDASPVHIYYSTGSTSITFNSSDFGTLVNGGNVSYYAVLNASNVPVMASEHTIIIEKKWENKNIIYYNDGNRTLKVPLKFIPNAYDAIIEFTRIDGASSFNDVITNNDFILGVPLTNFNVIFSTNGYLSIPNNSTTNLKTVHSGLFKCKIKYRDSFGFQIGSNEVDVFDLTKVGQLSTSASSNKVVIFIGGILNNMESDFHSLQTDLGNTGLTSSHASFSLASYLNANSFNCWYIAQPNIYEGKLCAYDIGAAIDSIYQINNRIHPASTYDISLICHSLGGLQLRALLESTSSNCPSLNSSLDGLHWTYPNFKANLINGNINRVLFLDVPHRGASLASAWLLSLGKSQAQKDLIPNSDFIKTLNASGNDLPIGMSFANLTGYNSYFDLDDNAVDLIESTLGFTPSGMQDITQLFHGASNILQMYQNNTDNVVLLHTHIHQNDILNNPGHVSTAGLHDYVYLNCNGVTNNLLKIKNFLDHNASYIPTCNTSFLEFVEGNAVASLLSGAKIFYKVTGDSSFILIGQTDETGAINFGRFGGMNIGDSIMVTAPDKETVVFSVDSTIITTHKFNIAMIPAVTSSLKVKYPAIQLVNQNPITTYNTIDIKVTGQNVLNYEINFPLNQDSIFIPLILTDSICNVHLDTGYNRIKIKFVGSVNIDTLEKEIFFFPDSMMGQNTYNLYVTCDSGSLGTCVYVNTRFVKEIKTTTDTIPVIVGINTVKLRKNGYVDSLLIIDSTATLSITSSIFPHSYSSLTDSSIINFITRGRVQYCKNVTLRDSAMQSIISVKQYDDTILGLGLISKSRKFEFGHLNTTWSNIGIWITLDQVENLSLDSIYLLKISNNTSYTKIPFDTFSSIANYDQPVQKLIFNYINFDSGTVTKEAIVVMKKLPPIINTISILSINENDSLILPLSVFFSDPDSVRNDMSFQIIDSTPTGLILSIRHDSLVINTNSCYSGLTSIKLNSTHDWLTRGDSISINVIPYPHAMITSTYPSIFCSGDSAVLIPTIGSGYQWLLAHTPISGATGSTYAASSSGFYSAIVTRSGCPDTTNEIEITVKPVPILFTPLNQSKCNGDTINAIFFTSSISSSTYAWVNSDTSIGLVAEGSSYIPSFTVVNSTYTPIITTVIVTPTANGCVGSSDTFTISVNPTPILTSALSPPAICGSTTFSYASASATAGVTYTWSRPFISGISNPAANGIGNPSEVLLNTMPNPIVVTYVDTLHINGCLNTQNISVTVNPVPTLSSSLAPPAICDSTLFSYMPSSATSGTVFSWSRPLVTGISNPATSGTLNPNEILHNTTPNPIPVIYVDTLKANGCVNTQNVTVFVNPKPILSSSLTPPAICDSTVFSYLHTSATAGTTFSWSRSFVPGISNVSASGIGNPNEVLHNTTAYPIPVTYVDTLKANGCMNTQSATVYVNPKPVLGSALTFAPICDSELFHYLPTGATMGTTITWSRSSILGISNPPATGTGLINEVLHNITPYPIAVVYIDTLEANGCGNTQAVSVTVNPKPRFNSSLTPPAICDSTVFSYIPTSLTVGTTFMWSRAMVTGISNPAASGTFNPNEILVNTTIGQVSAIYVYTLIATGCMNSQAITAKVNPKLTLVSSTTASVCSGTEFNYSQISTTPGTSFSWTRHSVTGISPTVASGPGNISETLYNSTLIPITVIYIDTLAYDGCAYTQSIALIVNPVPDVPLISTKSPSSLCSNTQFQNVGALISEPAGVNYVWGAVNAEIWAIGSGKQYCIINFHTPDVSAIITLSANVSGISCYSKDSFVVTVGSIISAMPDVMYNKPQFICLTALENGYQWGYDNAATLDSTLLVGEVNQNYYNNDPDFINNYYWVMTKHSNGCIQKSYENVPAGMNAFNAGNMTDVQIYPNPTENIVNVEVNATIGGNIEVRAIDMYGRKLATALAVNNKAKISLSGFASGSYLIVCYRNGIKIASKTIIKL